MSAFIIEDTTYRAALRPDGRPLIFAYARGFFKNSYPHSPKWILSCAGDIDAVVRDIGMSCSFIEDGITQLRSDQPVADWAQEQILKLQDTIPIIDLPHEAAIQTQNAAGLPIYSERETEQIRANLNALLAHHNLKDGDKVAVLENTDLLLALDRITVGCHNAWPKQPPAGARRLQVVETAASTKPPIVPKAWRIEGMRSAALWQTPEGNWAIGAKLELLQHFWRDLFPAQYASSDWQAGYHALRQSLMEGPEMPAQAITLGRPETPGADQRQWDDLFGPQAHEGSLAVVAQRLGNHILGEMLLRSSSVKAVDPAAIEAIESQQQAEAIDDGQDDAHRPR